MDSFNKNDKNLLWEKSQTPDLNLILDFYIFSYLDKYDLRDCFYTS